LALYIWLKLNDESAHASLSDEEKFFLDGSKQKHPFPEPFTEYNHKDGIYLSVVVPSYNEEKRLDKMMVETIQYLMAREKKQPNFTWEIIIVSDGSKDNTVNVAYSWVLKYNTKNIRILHLTINRGKGGAVKRGMMVARGKYMLMVDADGATKFSDIDKVEQELLKIENNGYGIGIGSRSHLQGEAEAKRTFFRNFLMWSFHLVVKYIGGVRVIRDTQCGFKLFSRNSAHVLFNNLHLSRWAFDVELLWLAQKQNIPIKEITVNWKEIAGSHLEEEDTRIVSIKMFKDLIRFRFSYIYRIWTINYNDKFPPTKNKKNKKK